MIWAASLAYLSGSGYWLNNLSLMIDRQSQQIAIDVQLDRFDGFSTGKNTPQRQTTPVDTLPGD